MNSAGVIAARSRPLHRPNARLGLTATCAAGSVGVALGVTPIGARLALMRSTNAVRAPVSNSLIRSFRAAAAIVASASTARVIPGATYFASTWSNICPSTYFSPASRIEKMR